MDRISTEKGRLDDKGSRRMSVLLSRYLDREFHLAQNVVNFKRKSLLATEWLSNDDNSNMHQFHTGSRSEGVSMLNSDIDIMYIDRLVTVLYPDQPITQNNQHKTILHIRGVDNCRPGFVALELCRGGKKCRRTLLYSLVEVGGKVFVSSDMFRERNRMQLKVGKVLSRSNGPSNTLDILSGIDTVVCFPCDNWPREADDWISRTRLHGWPSENLISKIRQKGCHLVPIGDKCYENTGLQWRLTFVTAERRLVHSLSHIQFQVYILLKYFLKQIQGTLKDTIGDADILCSYFMKTLIFFAVENSRHLFWQERNLFYCFWFCFNILIEWVLVGYCPNYFIPTNNMFQRKVHGQHQQKLLEILNKYHRMKWMCLSVGKYFPPIANSLFNAKTQAELQFSNVTQEIDFNMDIAVRSSCRKGTIDTRNPLKTMAKALHLMSKSQTQCDEVRSYCCAMEMLSQIAGNRVNQGNAEPVTGNKSRYTNIRKCKRWMIPWASLGTNMLYLATFYFLLGDFRKSLQMCEEVAKLASCFKNNVIHRSQEEKARYVQKYSGHGHTLLSRCKKEFIDILMFSKEEPWLCLPQLHSELSNCTHHIHIPPLPYALFLSFLCRHELGDTRRRDAALADLIVVKYDREQGGHRNRMLITFLEICYQTIGDTRRAARAYQDSQDALAAGNFP
ncbi:uncharacterized protein LOC117330030 [Pecten maximus]|uniref:uncharacterized protein LOC117330030 n=1 Tax=Pecten maximus TaxID=6579 RepID=UPI001458783A|nr:uncharacterized protein LOC117330030 [Pecten maximus]